MPWLVGSFNTSGNARPKLVPNRLAALPDRAVTNVRVDTGAVLLVSWDGRCVYASRALTTMLQCAPGELLGDGWRRRISPFAGDAPFNPEHAVELANQQIPIRLRRPDGGAEIVSRLSLVADITDPSIVTGFMARVQVVQVHHRRAQEKTA
jgi:PAS domain-containing protein